MSYPSDRYGDFWAYQGNWSQETFGTDKERGPVGPMLHLQKEVQETLDSLHLLQDNGRDSRTRMEIVDCFFLVTDAARRAGLRYHEFMDLCFEKLEINQNRKWVKNPNPNQPTEHDRSGE